MTNKKHNCEVKTDLGCNNQCVRRYTGHKKGDPKFYCCIGCQAILRRNGVKLKEVPDETRKTPRTNSRTSR